MLNTKVTANISTMFCCCGSSGRLSIVNMLAVTFVFNTKGFPPFVLLSRLCLESYVIPLLDFRLGSYEPYQKFPTYFVGVFVPTESVFCRVHISIANFRYISEIYGIFCRLLLFQLKSVFCSTNKYRTNFIANKLKKVVLQTK